MFHISNIKNRNIVFFSLALIVAYGFQTTMLWDSYWGEWYESSPQMENLYAFGFIFLCVISRALYVQRAFMALASVWLVANFIPTNFQYWTQGGFNEFLVTALYLAGAFLFIRFGLAENGLIHQQLPLVISRFQNAGNRVFGLAWMGASALLSVIIGIVNFQSMWGNIVHRLLHMAGNSLTVFISSYILFVFIDDYRDTFKNMAANLNDFSLNTYLTRTISSWLYAVIHFCTVASIGIAVPLALNAAGFDGLGKTLMFVLGFIPFLIFMVVIAYLVLMLIRLVFEYSNALIHIAQNTSR